MKNIELAQKIKQLRVRKGLSQEKLSEIAKINLRTIQRIENGETEPRGETLTRIAVALNVTPDDLIIWAEQEDKGFLVLLNLSALAFIVFPLLGIIVPLAIWISKRGKIKETNEIGKSILNFQISWSLFIFIIYAFFILQLIFHVRFIKLNFSIMNMGGVELLLVFVIPLLYIINGAYIILNSFKSYHGKRVFYKPAIRFLK